MIDLGMQPHAVTLQEYRRSGLLMADLGAEGQSYHSWQCSEDSDGGFRSEFHPSSKRGQAPLADQL